MKFFLLLISTALVGCTHAFVSGVGSSSKSPVLTELAGFKNSVTASYLNTLSNTPVVTAVPTTEVSIEVPLDLLDDALKSSTTAASSLLSQLRGSQTDREAFMINLLNEIDAPSSTPWWSKLRSLTRFSRRARRASLRRVLDLSTPTASEQEMSDEDADQRRRRRSLVIILRSLANLDEEDEGDAEAIQLNQGNEKSGPPAILLLEKAARREAKATAKPEDMAKRLPKGLETPTYTVVAERPKFEVRRYEPFSVCSVAMNKPRPAEAANTDAKISNPQLAGAGSFGALAGYLFGKNQEETAMKMTTPVLSRGEGESRQMSFVLPSDYWKEDGLKTAPTPMDGSGVMLERDEGGERAVVMFGGFAAKKNVEERTQQLLEGLSQDKEWQADTDATVSLAQYNDPFTPPWKRLNEVYIKAVPVVN